MPRARKVASKATTFRCPECKRSFESARALGSHRWRKHDVPGSARSTLAYHNKRQQAQSNGQAPAQIENPAFQNHLAYAFGWVESWLTIYADGLGVPPSVITNGVGELLLHQTRRKVLGS